MQCHISESRQRQVVMSGAASGQYKESDVVRDFQRDLAPVSSFLVGAATPLHGKRWQTTPRPFYFWATHISLVFRLGVQVCQQFEQAVFFCFLQFYDEFDGDVAACLALNHSYALARFAAVEHR